MTNVTMRTRLTSGGAILLMLLTYAGAAQAEGSYGTDFAAKYGSGAGTTSAAGCRVCHVSSGGGSPWNPYGQSIIDAGVPIGSGLADITPFLTAVENLSSDGTGIANIIQIRARAQPGWCNAGRAGCVNPGTPPNVLLDPPVNRDLNVDAKGDILWRHTDGRNYAWMVNGASIIAGVLSISSQGALPAVLAAGWSIAGIGDFNGDGRADILWRHTDGTNYVWMLNGQTITGGVISISSQGMLPLVDNTWSVAGIGDFNGDGKSDILWRKSDGTNYVWHVNGATISGGVLAIASQGVLPTVDTSWTVAGVADFNGDGKSDILWRKSDGTNYVWHVDGASISGGLLAIASQGMLPGVDTTWSVVGVGDYNGDGKADILWRRNDGTNRVWHVNGASISGGVLAIVSQGTLPTVADLSWSMVGSADYNGDGKSDVLWRHANGSSYVWHVNGAVITNGALSISSEGVLPSVTDAGWQVQNPK